MTPSNILPLWVSGRQRFLLDSFNGKDTRLHTQYLGALTVLRDSTNPDRIALAGHGLRELSEHLMRDAGFEKQKFNLGNEVHNLRPPWEKVQEEAKACSGVCANCAGRNLRNFLQRLSEFFDRHALNRPKATKRINSTIEQLDINGRIAGSNEHDRATKKWKEFNDFFNQCGHHSAPNLDELETNLFHFEELLIRLLFPSPSGDMAAIDEILAEENANIYKEMIDRALKEIKKGEAQRRYFFERAKSPDWLAPLADAGYFRQPPAPVADDQYISFPPWEQSRYLARMARIPAAQSMVLDIVDRIPETDNVQVHEDLLDVALAVPADAAVRFVPRVVNWLKSPHKRGLPYKLRDLIPHLANGGQSEAALQVTWEALIPQPDPRREERVGSALNTPEPQPRFADYLYKDIVDHAISPLARAAGVQAVVIFADLLEMAIDLMQDPEEDGDEDYLYCSQGDLGAGPRYDRLPNILLCSTRRIAEEAVKLVPESFEPIVADLKSRRWISFRRLTLHLCTVFPDLGASETALYLADTEVLERPSTQLEAKGLLRVSFAQLPGDVQDSILNWIERGPDRDAVVAWFGESVNSEQIDEYCGRWRRDLLAMLEGQLPDQLEDRLRKQIALLGQPNPPQAALRSSSQWVGPKSPMTSDRLLLLSPQQVIEYLRAWQPPDGLFEATMDGLGRVLAQVVAQRANEYSMEAEAFKRVDPTYVRAYFQGLLAARKQKAEFAWAPVLELAAWLASQPREIPGRTGRLMDRDADWGWSRSVILDLLEESLDHTQGSLQVEHREEVWSVLRPLTDDPDPTQQRENKYGGRNMDPATMAINTVRGDAFTCLVRFAVWVRRLIENSTPEGEWPPRSFDTMPYVREVLDSHLDVEIEPSLAIRSIYGRCLPVLASLDWDWTVASLPRIFVVTPTELPRLQAAWESFVVFNPPNNALLPVLLPYYRSAIDRLPSVPSLMKHPSSPEDSLAEHLAVLYWHDRLRLDEVGGLIPRFFGSAPPKVRGHLIWFVGSGVSQWEEDVPSVVFDRLRELFEHRVRVAREAGSPTEFTEELSSFGLWFTSKRFGDEWSLSMLQTVLDLVGEVSSERSVGERLVELAPRLPLQCVTVLAIMISRAKEPWLMMAIQDSAKEVIRIACGSSDPDAVFTATGLAEDLINQQHFEFREVL
jgi:hypothetical protein